MLAKLLYKISHFYLPKDTSLEVFAGIYLFIYFLLFMDSDYAFLFYFIFFFSPFHDIITVVTVYTGKAHGDSLYAHVGTPTQLDRV